MQALREEQLSIQKPSRYRVSATHQGESVVFNVEATTGTKAVAEARRQARLQGMKFIMVNQVTPVEPTIFRYDADSEDPLTARGGANYNPPDTGALYAGKEPGTQLTTLSLNEITDRIQTVWDRMVVFTPRPDVSPLRAYEQNGRVYLDDGISGRLELLERTSLELVMVLYEWATYTGYSSEDFGEFVQQCWT